MRPTNNIDLPRRNVLKKGLQLAGGVAIAVSGGLVYRAIAQDILSPFDGPAYEPWTSWKTQPLSFPLITIQMAILAASPHNTQPWLFKVTQHSVEVFADRRKHLGSFDPFRREMQIGLGCAIENMTLAAKAHGYDSQVEVVEGQLPQHPELDGIDKIATVLFTKGKTDNSALYQAIAQRHTDRNPYDVAKSIPADIIHRFVAESQKYHCRLDVLADDQDRASVSLLMLDATRAIVQDEAMVLASHHWFRASNKSIQTHRDGPTLDSVGLSTTIRTLAKIFPQPSAMQSHRIWEKATAESHLATAAAFGLISIPYRYSKSANLSAGRLWQRLHLMASTAGISMHPMNQPVEWIDRQRQLAQTNHAEQRLALLTQQNIWHTTFVFRMGYPTVAAAPSPRRPVEDSLI
jgi:hypothetical protein